jgi:hypothetical protein
MDLPKLKKRISNFILKEEGRISKQSLVSMGAFLGAGVFVGVNNVKDVNAWPSSCPDYDWDKGCPGREPGNCGAVSKTAAEVHNAYNDDGSVKYAGDGYCVDDEPFHFNGIDFSYAGKTLTAKHHHHGSHNSY